MKEQFPVTPPRRSFHLGYHPSLDGLRGIAILLVLLTHGGVLSATSLGFIGVNTFFVLSGFLITCLLISEYDQSNAISLRHFYLRRALRLLPVLTTMLSLFVLSAILMESRLRALQDLLEALRALFYFTNWARIFGIGPNDSLAHIWSLSVEEQFYLIWPVFLLFLLKRQSRSSLLCWILLGVFLSAALRVFLFLGTNIAADTEPAMFNPATRADSLLLGCSVGVLLSSNLLPRGVGFAKGLKSLALLSCLGLLILGMFWPGSGWMLCIGWFLDSLFAAFLVAYLASAGHGGLHRILENRVLVYVGQISYGLYVWHYPILRFLQRHHLPWQHFLFLLPVLPVVLASFYFIEKPCLRLKRRFAGAR